MALIEEIALHVKEMAGEEEMACCVEATTYKDIWPAAIREVLVCSTEPTNIRKFLVRCRIKFA